MLSTYPVRASARMRMQTPRGGCPEPIATKDDILRLARERLGFDELRPGQAEAIASVTAGRDTLCVMIT